MPDGCFPPASFVHVGMPDGCFPRPVERFEPRVGPQCNARVTGMRGCRHWRRSGHQTLVRLRWTSRRRGPSQLSRQAQVRRWTSRRGGQSCRSTQAHVRRWTSRRGGLCQLSTQGPLCSAQVEGMRACRHWWRCGHPPLVRRAGCQEVCAGQAFTRRGLRRGRGASQRMWVKVVPQPVWSAFEMVAWAAASERARGHKWKIATSSHGRRSLPQ